MRRSAAAKSVSIKIWSGQLAPVRSQNVRLDGKMSFSNFVHDSNHAVELELDESPLESIAAQLWGLDFVPDFPTSHIPLKLTFWPFLPTFLLVRMSYRIPQQVNQATLTETSFRSYSYAK
jgi:hypothetical protein